LGHESVPNCKYQGIPSLISSLQGKEVTSASLGSKHLLVITSTGRLYSSGVGDSGALGHGNRMSSNRLRLVEALRKVRVISVSAGRGSYGHSGAIDHDGEAWKILDLDTNPNTCHLCGGIYVGFWALWRARSL